MDRVCELDLPTQTIQKFNLCRLFKETHFITEIYDSRHKNMHQEILRPTKCPFKDMKWPCVQVPKPCWKVWEAILKTLHMSASVSGFFPGQMIRKHLFRFLQSSDRKHLLSKIGSNQYHVYILNAFSRNKYIYSRQQIHYTVRYSLVGFKGVQVQIFGDVIVTDGYPEPNSTFHSNPPTTSISSFSQPSIVECLADERRRNYMTGTSTIYNKPTHMEVPQTQDARIL